MMESARQELQGRREYMSNDEIKRLTESIKCHGTAAHSLIIRGFTLLFTWDTTTTKVRSHPAWDHDDTKTLLS